MSSKEQIVFHPRMTKRPPFSAEVPNYTPVAGETIPRRNCKTVEKLESQLEAGVATLYDLLKRSSEKYGNARAMGTRTLLKTHTETKKVKKLVDGEEREVDKNWTYFEMSGYRYISFIEFERLAIVVGSGLRQLGLTKGDRVHIFAASRLVSCCRLRARAGHELT